MRPSESGKPQIASNFSREFIESGYIQIASERFNGFRSGSGGSGIAPSLTGGWIAASRTDLPGEAVIASLVWNRSDGPIKGAGAPLGWGDCICTTAVGAASAKKLEAGAPVVAALFAGGGLFAAKLLPEDSGTSVVRSPAVTSLGGRPCRARAVAVGTCRRRWLASAEALGAATAPRELFAGGFGG
jgi:hypothetical protein